MQSAHGRVNASSAWRLLLIARRDLDEAGFLGRRWLSLVLLVVVVPPLGMQLCEGSVRELEVSAVRIKVSLPIVRVAVHVERGVDAHRSISA
jgi:hypothetical protein